jgi:hypothetical protein
VGLNNNNMIEAIISILLAVGVICWRWVVGIDYMHKNHPDYKGEDLFGEWDDDKIHSEGDF